MSMSDITERVHALGNSWEQFKQLNEARLKEVEKKGAADPLYYEQLDRIGQAIDATKSRMDKLETAYNRPGKDAGEGYPIPAAYQGEYKQAFCAYLRKGIESGLEKFEGKALSVTSDPDGGYLVTSSLASRMIQIVFESSPIRDDFQ
ncbi:MAG: phage major capsid protein [Alphaproteobacteria bacterium]|nr:phage major capsid protein [Alphaproteobacteria bacterium]